MTVGGFAPGSIPERQQGRERKTMENARNWWRRHARVSRGVGAAALCLGGTLGLAACGSSSPSSSAGASSAPPASVTLVLDYQVDGSHAGFFVAQDKGYYKAANLNVTIQPSSGSVAAAQDVASGRATFGIVSGSTVATEVDNDGLPIKSVAVTLPHSPQATVVLKSSGITKPSQLAGKSVGSTPGSSDYLELPGFLKAVGLSPSSVTVVSLAASAKVPSLLAGKVDALDDFAEIFASHINQVTILPWYKYGFSQLGSTIVANTSWLTNKQHDAVLTRFLEASMKGYAYALGHVSQAATILANASAGAETASYFSTELGILKPYFESPTISTDGYGYMTASEWTQTQDINVQYGLQKSKLPLSRLYTNKYLGTPVK